MSNSFWLSPLTSFFTSTSRWVLDWILQTSSAAAEQPESLLSASSRYLEEDTSTDRQLVGEKLKDRIHCCGDASSLSLCEEQPRMFVRVFHGHVSERSSVVSKSPIIQLFSLPPWPCSVPLHHCKCPIRTGVIPNRDSVPLGWQWHPHGFPPEHVSWEYRNNLPASDSPRLASPAKRAHEGCPRSPCRRLTPAHLQSSCISRA